MNKKIKVYSLTERAKDWRNFLYSKLNQLFIFDGFPDSVNVEFLKFCLFHFGKAIFIDVDGETIVQPFSFANSYDKYYRPLQAIVVNPYIKGLQQFYTLSETPFITDTNFNVWNNYSHSTSEYGRGVISTLVWKTAYQLAENDISFKACQRNTRLTNIVTIDDDKKVAEFNELVSKMYLSGENTIPTSSTDLLNAVVVNPLTHELKGNVIELIELNQYIIANFLHSFGINSNYNLKRAQLQADEIAVNEFALKLNITDILTSLKNGCDSFNKKYKTNVNVYLNPKIYEKQDNEEIIENKRGEKENVSEFADIENIDRTGEDV